jgi:hypothetical protein
MTVREIEAAVELVHPSRRKALTAMLLAASAGMPFVALPVQTFANAASVVMAPKIDCTTRLFGSPDSTR